MRRAIAAAALILACRGVLAKSIPPGTYPFRTYGVDAGLTNLSAMHIAQDRTGFLWVATQDGVFRYDGNRFRHFGLRDGLPSSFVSSVCTDPAGDVWAMTGAGVVRFDGARFRTITTLPATGVNAIACDQRRHLWVAAQQGLYTGSGNRFTRVGGRLSSRILKSSSFSSLT